MDRAMSTGKSAYPPSPNKTLHPHRALTFCWPASTGEAESSKGGLCEVVPVHPPRLISAAYVHRLWGAFRQSYQSHLNATYMTTHQEKALPTATYKQLCSWKETRKNGARKISLAGLKKCWSFEAMEEAPYWLMKSQSVMASACDNSRILKAQTLLLHLMPSSWEQSGHYPTAFCYGATCGSETGQLSAPHTPSLTGMLAGVSFPSCSPLR